MAGVSNPRTLRPAKLNASSETLLGANAHSSTTSTHFSKIWLKMRLGKRIFS